MSLQTLAVFLIAIAFGSRLAVATLLLYLAEGAFGLPVFQGTPEKGIGLAYMVGPTGGYLLGFLAAAAIVGLAADRGFDRNPLKLFAAVLVAEAVMMAFGFGWLSTLIGAEKAGSSASFLSSSGSDQGRSRLLPGSGRLVAAAEEGLTLKFCKAAPACVALSSRRSGTVF